MNAVSLDTVSVTAGRKRLLADFSCTVSQGDFLVVIGPNGAGKTTLLKVLSGLHRPSAGTVQIFDRPLENYSRRELAATVALVPQQLHLEFAFTVAETVLMGRSPHLDLLEQEREGDHRIAFEAMRFTQVDHLADRRLDQLSGGERQRVMIARAICQQPRIMLLDEPTAALDPAHQLVIMELMERLRREEGVTVIMVSHDLNLAGLFGGSIMLIREGQLVDSGPPPAILTAEHLEEVYGCAMHIDTHPRTGTPRVSLVPGSATRQGSS